MEPTDNYFYSNALELALTNNDISLRFIRNTLPPAGNAVAPGVIQKNIPPVRAAECFVVMSPQHAKAVLGALMRTVLEYEKTFGTLSVASELQKQLSDAIVEGTAKWKI